MIDDATLLAYLDGELHGTEAAAVEAALVADPELRTRYETHRALGEQLRAAFAPLIDVPVPDRIMAAMRPSAEIISLADARERRSAPMPERRWTQWGSLAATLVAGLIGGYMLNVAPSGPVVEHGGRIIASAPLAHALDQQLASAETPGAPIRIGLSFHSHDGNICRSFEAGAADGLACREADSWMVRGLFATPKAGDGKSAYRMASSGNLQLMAMVDDMIDGAPLDAAQERIAKAKHWQAR